MLKLKQKGENMEEKTTRKIEEIDKNFVIKESKIKEGTRVYNACQAPFSLHGVFAPTSEHDLFLRMNPDTAAAVSDSVAFLNTNCAGGRVRFKTNSSYIAIKAVLTNIGKMPHFALTGSAGFDLYSGSEHMCSFQPKFDITDELFGEYNVKDCTLKDYTLNFPLYSGVKELYIILDEDAAVQKAEPYKNDKPLVFYGSSITQGGCASRPGTAYPDVVSRRLNLDYINLGFSGSAKGEEKMAKYIAGLDMCAFVYDYDHNSPNAEYLNQTHEKFFKIVRKAHPELPIICATQPFTCSKEYKEKAQIIKNTVLNAKKSGDEHVYFINMNDYLGQKGVLNEGSVDKCHPNDLGFYFMADAIEEIIEVF